MKVGTNYSYRYYYYGNADVAIDYFNIDRYHQKVIQKGADWRIYSYGSANGNMIINWLIWHPSDEGGGYTSKSYNLGQNQYRKWHYIVCTYEKNNRMKLYIDGELKGNWSAPNKGIHQSNSDVYLGHHNKIKIDELRCWNRILTEEEIEAFYTDNNRLYSFHNYTISSCMGNYVDSSGYVLVQVVGGKTNTAPNTPSNPSPSSSTVNVVDVSLSVDVSDPDGDSLDVSFYDASDDSLIGTDSGVVSGGSASVSWNGLSEGSDYSWYVVVDDGNGGSRQSSTWFFSVNAPPDAPSDPTPANDAADQDLFVDLSWSAGDPDSDPLTFDVYFEAGDSSPDVKVSDGQTGTTYDPGSLSTGTTYYWKVVAYDSHAGVTSGPVWHFTTMDTSLTVYTEDPDVTGFNPYTATLYGHLADMGSASSVDVWFIYDETSGKDPSNFNHSTPHQSMSSTGNFEYSFSSSEFYVFRAAASDGIHTVYGEEKYVFRHFGACVDTLDATNLLLGGATLNGDLKQLSHGGSGVDVWFVYDTSYHYDVSDYSFSTSPITKTSTGTFSETISGLTNGVEYHFRAVADDPFVPGNPNGWGLDLTFTPTENNPPNTPSNPFPPDQEAGYLLADESGILGTTLQVDVSDPDGNPMAVTFHDASDDSEIGTDTDVPSGGTASVFWSGLSALNTYSWYVIADDGNGGQTRGPTTGSWSFRASSFCCLPAGTKITMADGTYKNIENVVVGDKVLSFDTNKKSFIRTTVQDLILKMRNVYDINDGLISPTDDHPFYVKKGDGRVGWAAINPEKSKNIYDKDVMQLEVGDQLFTQDSRWITVYSIERRSDIIQTYTFAVDSDVHDYFANGFLVSNIRCFDQNPCFPAGTMVTMADETTKPIEEITIGDKVLSYNLEINTYATSTVLSKESPFNVYYNIDNGLLKVTDNHPFYVKKGDGRVGWAAINPEKSKNIYDKDVMQLEVGDRFATVAGVWSEPIYSITLVDTLVQTYSLGLKGINNFFADGVLVAGIPSSSAISHSNTLYENYMSITVREIFEDNVAPNTIINKTVPSDVKNVGSTLSSDVTFNWYGVDTICPEDSLEFNWVLDGFDDEWNGWSSTT
ncbi:hypothetical protein DRN32_05900, partial [Thermococci archaeon]